MESKKLNYDIVASVAKLMRPTGSKMNLRQLQTLFPHAAISWLTELVEQCAPAGIDTVNEQASFLGQLNHESCGLTRFEESFNYTPEAAMRVFNRYRMRITPEEAQIYCRTLGHPANQPMIADIVYENMLGNGPRLTGDGWRNRGMGPIQTTGATNRRKLQDATGLPYLDESDLLLQPKYGILAAVHFWKSNGLDALDDDSDVRAERLKVNGSDLGLAETQAFTNRCIEVLNDQG